MKFIKMQSAGNDYVYIYADNLSGIAPGNLAVKMSAKHFGIGADGLVIVGKEQGGRASMRMFNSDGSEGLMCGNAAICIGKIAAERLGLGNSFTLDTASGEKKIEYRDGVSTVYMGVPCFLGDGLVFVGNTHRVLFCENAEKFPLEKLAYTGGNVNIDAVSVAGDDLILIRTFERGSGETLSCGSGACASVFAAASRGLIKAKKDIKVKSKGGILTVRLEENGEIALSGKAEIVFEGEYSCI